jgi:hypothetical protein
MKHGFPLFIGEVSFFEIPAHIRLDKLINDGLENLLRI